ncbi:hypothetical protein BGX20_001154, partial [Mortierella sp. AD010]
MPGSFPHHPQMTEVRSGWTWTKLPEEEGAESSPSRPKFGWVWNGGESGGENPDPTPLYTASDEEMADVNNEEGSPVGHGEHFPFGGRGGFGPFRGRGGRGPHHFAFHPHHPHHGGPHGHPHEHEHSPHRRHHHHHHRRHSGPKSGGDDGADSNAEERLKRRQTFHEQRHAMMQARREQLQGQRQAIAQQREALEQQHQTLVEQARAQEEQRRTQAEQARTQEEQRRTQAEQIRTQEQQRIGARLEEIIDRARSAASTPIRIGAGSLANIWPTGSAEATNATATPAVNSNEFQTQIEQLIGMGFADTDQLRNAVRDFHGDVEAVVDYMLSSSR